MTNQAAQSSGTDNESSLDFSDYVTKVAVVSDLRDKTEQLCVGAGSRLFEASVVLERVRQALSVFSAMEEQGTFTELKGVSERYNSEINDLTEDMFRALATISSLMSRTEIVENLVNTLRDSIDAMKNISREIRNRVEKVVPAESEVGASLHLAANEACELVNAMEATLGGTDAPISKIKERIQFAAQHRNDFENLLMSNLAGPVEELNDQIRECEMHVRGMTSKSDEIGRRTTDLITATGLAVAGLQIGDNTRQRLGHVLTILSRVHDRDDQSRALSTLAAHQMTDIATRHAEGIQGFKDGCVALEDGILDLVRNHLVAFKKRDRSENFQTCLLDLENCMRGAVKAQQQLKGFADILTDEVDTLTRAVAKEAEFEHQIRAIGRGIVHASGTIPRKDTELEIEAKKLEMLADITSNDLARLKTELVAIKSLALEVAELLGSSSQRAAALPNGAIQDLCRGINKIAEATVAAAETIAQIDKTIAANQGWMKPLETHTDMILSSLKHFSGDYENSDFSDRAGDIASEIFNIYTMEQERDVHRAVFNMPEDATIPRQKPVRSDAAEDIIGDVFF